MQMDSKGSRKWENMTGKAFKDATSIAIVLDDNNPFGMAFSKDGKRLFQAFRETGVVVQYSLNNAFDLSSSTNDGEFDLSSLDSNLDLSLIHISEPTRPY